MNYMCNVVIDTISIRLANGNIAIQLEVEAFIKMMEEKYGSTPKPKS